MRRHQRSRAAFPWRSATPAETSLPVAMIVGWRCNAAATSKSVSDSRSIGGSHGRHLNSAMRSWARLSWRCGARCSGICPTTISMPWRRAAWPRPRRCRKNPHKICAGFPSGHRQSDADRARARRRCRRGAHGLRQLVMSYRQSHQVPSGVEAPPVSPVRPRRVRQGELETNQWPR